MKPSNTMIPVVIERHGEGERSYDLYSRLLKDRIIFLNGPVEDEVAGILIAQFLFLDAQDKDKEIWFYINSPGGVVTAGFAIYDAMTYIKAPINTVCIGQAASMGAFLLTMGDKDRRYASPNSRIMIHSVSGGFSGSTADSKIQLKEMLRLEEIIYQHMADKANKSIDQLKKDCERDNFMSAKEAMEYGLIDSIIDVNKKS